MKSKPVCPWPNPDAVAGQKEAAAKLVEVVKDDPKLIDQAYLSVAWRWSTRLSARTIQLSNAWRKVTSGTKSQY